MSLSVPAINAAQLTASGTDPADPTIAFASYTVGHHDGTAYSPIQYSPSVSGRGNRVGVFGPASAGQKRVTVAIASVTGPFADAQHAAQGVAQVLLQKILQHEGLSAAAGDHVLDPTGVVLV